MSLSDLVLFPKYTQVILDHFTANNYEWCRDFGPTLPGLIASISGDDDAAVYDALGYSSCHYPPSRIADHVEPIAQDCLSNSASLNPWLRTVLDTSYGKGNIHYEAERV
jgi:hypothetical protein